MKPEKFTGRRFRGILIFACELCRAGSLDLFSGLSLGRCSYQSKLQFLHYTYVACSPASSVFGTLAVGNEYSPLRQYVLKIMKVSVRRKFCAAFPKIWDHPPLLVKPGQCSVTRIFHFYAASQIRHATLTTSQTSVGLPKVDIQAFQKLSGATNCQASLLLRHPPALWCLPRDKGVAFEQNIWDRRKTLGLARFGIRQFSRSVKRPICLSERKLQEAEKVKGPSTHVHKPSKSRPLEEPTKPQSTNPGKPSAIYGSQKPLIDRISHIPQIHRPSKEELLAAATGFWSRLKIRFKWFSIRSARPFNADEIGAFFSWVLLGHVLWIVLGTTTFFSLAILAVNTVFAQGKFQLGQFV